MKLISFFLVSLGWMFLILVQKKEMCAAEIIIPDSMKLNTFRTNDYFASTNFNSSKNWNAKNSLNILVFGSINTFNKKKRESLVRICELRCELGYNHWIDSIWIKSTDNFFISSIWATERNLRMKKSILTNLKTQLTDSWEYETVNSKLQRKWVAGPFTPGTINIGAGLLMNIDKKSYINFSLIALKLNSLKLSDKRIKEHKTLIETDKILVSYEYGFNIQSLFEITLGKKINFESKSEFFTSNIQKKKILLDVQNILGIKPFKLFKVQFMSKIAYDSMISDKIQLKHEMLFGVSFK